MQKKLGIDRRSREVDVKQKRWWVERTRKYNEEEVETRGGIRDMEMG